VRGLDLSSSLVLGKTNATDGIGYSKVLGAGGGSDEGAPALPGDDEAALAQDLHRVPHCLIGDAVLLRERALGWQLVLDLADFDPARDVVRYLDIGEVGPERVNNRHVVNVDALLAA
jgi:hypothetical protein